MSTRPSSASDPGADSTASDPASASSTRARSPKVIPSYLRKRYWWAYLHPAAVRFFEHPHLVDAILWGNFKRLRDSAFDALGLPLTGRTLQIACVYGEFSAALAERLDAEATLHLVDIAPIQLANTRRKLGRRDGVVTYGVEDSTRLSLADGEFDQTILFFLLHEQPPDVRQSTLSEALRVTKPGGRCVIVDYHRPHWANPVGYLMRLIFALLEPYALSFWRESPGSELPEGWSVEKKTLFGSLYQRLLFKREKR